MDVQDVSVSRRLGLIRGARLLFGATVVVLVARPSTANAAKADKRDFLYQDRPKDGKSCSTCRLYSAAAGKGRCAVVDGEISANGWCMAYSPTA